MMPDFSTFQDDAAFWHATKYPDATLQDVQCKFAEEAGELVRALNRYRHYATQVENGEGGMADAVHWAIEVEGELGDVLVTLGVMAGRFLDDQMTAMGVRRFYDDVQHRP